MPRTPGTHLGQRPAQRAHPRHLQSASPQRQLAPKADPAAGGRSAPAAGSSIASLAMAIASPVRVGLRALFEMITPPMGRGVRAAPPGSDSDRTLSFERLPTDSPSDMQPGLEPPGGADANGKPESMLMDTPPSRRSPQDDGSPRSAVSALLPEPAVLSRPSRAGRGLPAGACSPVPPPPPLSPPLSPPMALPASRRAGGGVPTVWLPPRGRALDFDAALTPGAAHGAASGGAAGSGSDRLRALFPDHAATIDALEARAGRGDPLLLGGTTPPQDLGALLAAYERHVAPARPEDAQRVLGALDLLVSRQIEARRLDEVAGTGSWVDLARAVAGACFKYSCSFMSATLAAGALQQQLRHEDSQAGAPDAPLADFMSQAFVFLVGSAIIGAGMEMANSAWRSAGLSDGYTRMRLAEGPDRSRWVQAAAALPFGLLYATHDSEQGPMGPADARIGWGALAAAASGAWTQLGPRLAGAHPESTWIDGSSDAALRRMDQALDWLEQPGDQASEAFRQWMNSPWAGHTLERLRGLLPGQAAVTRAVARAGAASLARILNLAAYAFDGQADLRWRIGADAFLGLSWGLLSTWPETAWQWVSRPGAGRVAAPATASARVAPAQALDAVAPPAPGR